MNHFSPVADTHTHDILELGLERLMPNRAILRFAGELRFCPCQPLQGADSNDAELIPPSTKRSCESIERCPEEDGGEGNYEGVRG